MQLIRGFIISAFQDDYRMMAGFAGGPAPGVEFRAFSPVMLWAMPIVLVPRVMLSQVMLWAMPIGLLSQVMLWAMPIVMLSKAFSLLGCSAEYRDRELPIFSITAHTKCPISPQAESLTHHNLGHRPKTGHRPRSGYCPRSEPPSGSGHCPSSPREVHPLISGHYPKSSHRPRLSATCRKRTANRSAPHPGSRHHLRSNHQHRHNTMLQKLI
jgi:hypothetical protein